MTTKYEDDITGEQYGHESVLERFAIITMDDCFDQFDAHVDVVHEEPERVAERLHEGVDAWLESFNEALAEADDEEIADA